MKKIYSLLFVVVALTMNAQTTISQWNFDDLSPATAMLPTTGAGTFSIIGGVVDNVTAGVMPAGNPATGKAYSIKTFPATGTASGTAGYQFLVSTVGFTQPINVTFDPRGSNTSSRFQQYEYTTNGSTWTILGNNAGALVNSFLPGHLALTFPASCNNNANFGFRIVSIFDPAGTDYSAVGYMNTPTPSNYSAAGTWRLDNVTFSSGTLSVNQNTIAGLKVYPNPVTNGTLYIESDVNAERTVVVYDILGNQVIKTTTTSNAINVSALNAGVYMVKITEEGKTATRKLVIR
jgi:Secretion system C-terminal sorting domain